MANDDDDAWKAATKVTADAAVSADSPVPRDLAARPAPGDDDVAVVGNNYWDGDSQCPQSDIRRD